MRKYLILLSLATLAKSSFSQLARPQSKPEIITACDKFMDLWKDGQFEASFHYLKHYSVIEDNQLDSLGIKVAHQMTALKRVYGRILGYERVSNKEVRNTVLKLVYIVKFEKSFLQLYFILYNPGTASGWTITNFKYSEGFEELNFEEPKRP